MVIHSYTLCFGKAFFTYYAEYAADFCPWLTFSTKKLCHCMLFCLVHTESRAVMLTFIQHYNWLVIVESMSQLSRKLCASTCVQNYQYSQHNRV
jgi:hypothetical protein